MSVSLKTFLSINGFMFIPFGIMMLLIPTHLFPMLQVELDNDGLVMASTVGSMLFSFGLICWFARGEEGRTVSMKAILVGNFAFHAIDCFLTGKAAITGVMNEAGFIFSTMHFIFALGFMYYIWKMFIKK